MTISVTIITLNEEENLERCLKSISSLVHEIIVVDNNSQDGLAEMVKNEFMEVKLIEAGENRGYAAGNNLGIKKARGKYILILNPDVTILSDAITKLFDFLEQNPRAGIVGPQIKNPDGSIQYSCSRFPDWRLPFFRRTFLSDTKKGRQWNSNYLMMDWGHRQNQQVDWLFGACLMVRQEAIDQVGLLDEGYFLTAIIPESAKSWVTLSEAPKAPMVASVRTPVEALAPGQAAQFSYVLYFGPKNLNDLQPLGLSRAVDFGWFDFLGKPLLTFLSWLERYSFNYGWAIVILTILLRIVFWYPNHKSYKSMKDMAKLQPKVAKLREKYKDDKETMNKELMALYRTFKVNPMAGCLPMVMQLPVFVALYNVLGYAIELRHASFIPTLPFTNIVWLADLSAKDPLLITPIIMGATMFLQQKMTPSTGDPAQAKMMMFLPLIFTFMFLNFASGLVVYWLVNNVLSIAQQHYTNKYLT